MRESGIDMDRLLAAFRNVRGKMMGTMEGIAQHYIVPSLQVEGCTLDPSLPVRIQ
jgi:hypothetical protein